MAVVQKSLPIGEYAAAHDTRAGQSMGGGFDDFELADDRVSDAFDLGQPGHWCAHHTVEI